VLARQDEIQDDAEDRRVAATPSFDAEDDAAIPVETSEFPLTMIGSDGDGISNTPAAATVTVAGRRLAAEIVAAEEQPGSARVTPPRPEGGGQ
jgi:multicomponent Na+:H+ antiporter subunit C